LKKADIVTLLNQDIEGEHGAIIQYLSHAYAMGEGEMACEIEAISREEMRHLDMLANAIVDLGGTPSMKRGVMHVGGKTVSAWMKNNVTAEEVAIKLYKEHIKLIDDEKIIRTLKRILSDEESHHGDFTHLIAKAKKEAAKDLRDNRHDRMAEILNWGIEHEYTVVLQYLLHSYMAKDCEFKQQMQEQAINEMQHMGWLSEKMVDSGGSPRIEHTGIVRRAKKADMLKADIDIETEVAKKYAQLAKEVKDTGVKKLLSRIGNHEKYHIEVFNDLLKKEK
jgi:bacterioferritin